MNMKQQQIVLAGCRTTECLCFYPAFTAARRVHANLQLIGDAFTFFFLYRHLDSVADTLYTNFVAGNVLIVRGDSIKGYFHNVKPML